MKQGKWVSIGSGESGNERKPQNRRILVWGCISWIKVDLQRELPYGRRNFLIL